MEATEKYVLNAKELFYLRQDMVWRTDCDLTKADSWYKYSIGDMPVDTGSKILLSAKEAYELRENIIRRCDNITIADYCYRYIIGDSEAVKDFQQFSNELEKK